MKMYVSCLLRAERALSDMVRSGGMQWTSLCGDKAGGCRCEAESPVLSGVVCDREPNSEAKEGMTVLSLVIESGVGR